MGAFTEIGAGDRHDVIVIGGGLAGYNTAIRAAQLGLGVVCVERTAKPGGTGLLTGCIPSKLLLHASEMYDVARNGDHAALGIEGAASLNLPRMMSYKAAAVDRISKGVQSLLHKHQVTVLQGEARLAGPGRVIVRRTRASEVTLHGKDIVIATGSEPIPFPAADFDHIQIVDSADALSLDHVPRHLAIVGAGAVGVEIGSIWRRLGARVTLVERCARVCPWLDSEVAAVLEGALRRQGMAIEVSTEVVAIERRRDGIRLQRRTVGTGGTRPLDADIVLVAIGRRPATGGLGLESVGLQIDPLGALPHTGLRTTVPGIWVVGDATTGAMLAHKAEEEAIACAEQIGGLPGFVDYLSLPHVLCTVPEVAMIGKTEKELQAAGIAYKVGRFPFAASARAEIRRAPEGFVKLLVDARTHLIAGAHLVGPGVTDMVSEVAVAMESSTICEDLARTCHPFPTLADAVRQAAMAADGWMMQA